MHFISVLHIQGFLLLFLAVAMLFPLPFSLYYGGHDSTAFLISAGITALCGLVASRTTKMKGTLRVREGFAIVTFAWIFLSLFGSLPYLISGAIPSFTDAFYETMSGFTTTGSTILQDIEILPHGVLLWRSLTHWIGGMGIIVLSLAILPFLGVGGMQMFKAEVPGPVADKLTPRVAETAKILWGVYLLLTLIETALLCLAGMSFFESICHAFGTMATGGYSTRNASIGAYNSVYIDYIIIFFMTLAGVNFSLHYRFLRGDWRAYIRDKEFSVYLTIIGVATFLIGLDLFFMQGYGLSQTLQDSLFQVIAIITTTGYGTADYESWSGTSQFLLFTLMFIGGSAGSTSGGMKVMRIYVLFKFARRELIRLIHPHAVIPVRFGQTTVPRDVMTNVMGFFIVFIGLFMFGVFTMTLLGLDFESAFGATIASLSNIGPGLGSVGPTDNYAHIPAVGKWVLSLLMMMGRLEVFTVIVLLSPSYWQK